MDRTDWVLVFCEELRRLRPLLTLRAAWTIALGAYADGIDDPVVAARLCHRELGNPPSGAN